MKFIPVFLIACVLMFVPADMVLAQAQSDFVTCSGPDCSMCNLVQMANYLIIWLFGIFFLVFAVIMVTAGFGLVTSGGNQSALDAAKSKFKNGIIGLLIVMAAWLLVHQIMVSLLLGGEGQVGGMPWSQVQCQVQTVPNEWVETAAEPAGAVSQAPASGTPGASASHNDAVARLNAAGVNVKPGASLDGIQTSALDGIIALNNDCGCNIVITEGTGGTHSSGTYSHANGYKLDLRSRDNPGLVNYIQNNYTPAGAWSDGTRLYSNGNTTYAMESDHVDVSYRP